MLLLYIFCHENLDLYIFDYFWLCSAYLLTCFAGGTSSVVEVVDMAMNREATCKKGSTVETRTAR